MGSNRNKATDITMANKPDHEPPRHLYENKDDDTTWTSAESLSPESLTVFPSSFSSSKINNNNNNNDDDDDNNNDKITTEQPVAQNAYNIHPNEQDQEESDEMWMVDLANGEEDTNPILEQIENANLMLLAENENGANTATPKTTNPVGMITGQHHHMKPTFPRLPSTIVEESTSREEDDDDAPSSGESSANSPDTTPSSSRKMRKSALLLQFKRSFSLNDLPALIHNNNKNSHTNTAPSGEDKDNDELSFFANDGGSGSYNFMVRQKSSSSPASLRCSPIPLELQPPSSSSPPPAPQPLLPESFILTSPSNNSGDIGNMISPNSPPCFPPGGAAPHPQPVYFTPYYYVTRVFGGISKVWLKQHYGPLTSATWIGFWALLMVTCANYVLTPMRDAIALAVGVSAMPQLTLASTVLAFCSSVPIGWLFEAPDPNRRRLFKRMGLTRGETQGTSLALFYRCFALILLSYAIGFPLLEWLKSNERNVLLVVEQASTTLAAAEDAQVAADIETWQWQLLKTLSVWLKYIQSLVPDIPTLLALIGQGLYIAFFLVVHLMKLHSLSLMWGVTTEAMEYEEAARQRFNKSQPLMRIATTTTRLQRLSLISFGGTVGGILGSILASSLAQILYLPGLLVLAACLLEISAELSIELGRIMQKHWEQEQLQELRDKPHQNDGNSGNNDASQQLDTSMRRSVSLGSMKRVASGNSLNRVRSATDLGKSSTVGPFTAPGENGQTGGTNEDEANDNTFFQRLLRGTNTILRSRLLMAIFTYNALYASTTVLLSFQRAELVASRHQNDEESGGASSKEADMAFLANINMASSVAIFALQASGFGAALAQSCGPQGTLALMPLIRLAGVLALAWWHHTSGGKPPSLWVFLVVDECCKVMNMAVAKPVRENLWRGLSNEARYEAKPIVDTLANRWGGGSAAFLVSTLNKTLDLLGVPATNKDSAAPRLVFGYPPILFLCIIIAAWWAVVSADLGQIRRRIDLELKKRQ